MVLEERVVGSRLSLDEMVEDMLWYVGRDWVTYKELMGRYGEQSKGDYDHGVPALNIIFWGGMSEVFVEAVEALSLMRPHEEGLVRRIHPHPSSSLVYFMDGGVLDLPLVNRPPKGGYKELHWAPLSFRPGPSCTNPDCPWVEGVR